MMRGFILALVLVASPAFAVQPDEMLTDPGLEARARAISQNLRCPVCQGEDIDDSNAPISRDLRIAVRERLVAGDSDAQVVDYVVARYGEFVLFKPRVEGSSWLLWLAGPLMLLAGVGIAVATTRKRAVAAEAEGLSDADKTRLAQLLEK
ncbi:MAG: cytochrome c-type biosis protein CcmH [Cypionkella sp.]|nr:cytochrome c-type biosis protein CcmH [Cypionkella sp.]